METKTQQERLMLVRLSLHQWYPKRYDAKATRDVTSLHGVDPVRAGRFIKILVDLETIKPLQQRMRQLREDHYAMTAPWADGGDRVLPSGLYFDYVEMINRGETEIARLADEYAEQYEVEIDRARAELNGLFNDADYPDKHTLRGRFGIDYSFEPLPNPEDVRIWGIGDAAAAEIHDTVVANQSAAMDKAQAHVVEQVVERAREFIGKVRKYGELVQNDVKGARLYDSAIENLTDVLNLVMKGLNPTGDPELTKLAGDLGKAVVAINGGKLRNSTDTRETKTAEVEAIIGKFSGVYGA